MSRWILVLAALLGGTIGLGAFTFHYGEGLSYFSTDPRACKNCHIMNDQYASWTKGVHHASAKCIDCQLPYKREGAMKVSDHWVRSPMLNVSRACQSCRPSPESEIQARVAAIQAGTPELLARSVQAMTDMLDAIVAARSAGATDAELEPALAFQRKAQWRLDFVAAENSMGFHAPAEAARGR